MGGVRFAWCAAAVASAAAAAYAKKAAPSGQQSLAYAGDPCGGTSGGCRPSFLIIGVGKCGTSSLYYYLAEHPSVVPGHEKQVQWFDHAYRADAFATRYLGHFPKKLERGQITGEASPGYAQYVNVPARVALHLPGARILVIARDPADRAYSSYYYNYVGLAKDDALPFDVLTAAEIAFLEKYFAKAPGASCRHSGDAPGTDCRYDLSGDCYGKSTPQEQVGKAARAAGAGPGALPRSNQHLWRQLVGRSLYAVNLEWWYAAHAASDILLVCSEDLGDPSTAAPAMDRVAAFLGLDAFDFGPVVAKGKYNAGAVHRGYGHVTSWDDADKRSVERPPMDAGARAAIDAFARPFSERLFALADHRCAWHGAARGAGGSASF